MKFIQNILLIVVSVGLMFMSFSFYKLKENSGREYARLSSITYQSLKKLDDKILNEFLLLEKDGLSAEDVAEINSKILNKNMQ